MNPDPLPTKKKTFIIQPKLFAPPGKCYVVSPAITKSVADPDLFVRGGPEKLSGALALKFPQRRRGRQKINEGAPSPRSTTENHRFEDFLPNRFSL